MRHALLAVSLTLALLSAGGCIVHHRHRGAPVRNSRCATQCAAYGQRRVCNRRCSVWRNGVCAKYRQHCHNTRYCRRHATRCR